TAGATMTVVRFKKRVRRVRVSLRHYICTKGGPLRITSRLARELSPREVAAPQFANSIQRMIEVFVETVAGDIKDIQIRPTHARFDQQGKADLHYAAEAINRPLWPRVSRRFQIDGWPDRAIMRGRPSRSATLIEASGSRGFTRKSKSTTVLQLSQAITTNDVLKLARQQS